MARDRNPRERERERERDGGEEDMEISGLRFVHGGLEFGHIGFK
jgi:hypothetical protein